MQSTVKPWSPFRKSRNAEYTKIDPESDSTATGKISTNTDVPCFFGSSCNNAVVPLKDYALHLTKEHKSAMKWPMRSLRTESTRILYTFNGTELSSKDVLFCIFGQVFVPVATFTGGDFSFGMVCIRGRRRPAGPFTVIMRVARPATPKFFNSFPKDTLSLRIPASPFKVSGDGALEASACVVLKKSMLEPLCKKTVGGDGHEEVWEWNVSYDVYIQM